ncbi:MAG: hypothetical protein HY823_06530 [Acidobacteria bacterium]|nr:hypothetical protein [Acidobacteriota bacterium]
MERRWKPWLTAALLGLAALLPYAVGRLARYRMSHREQLLERFVDPLRGKPRSSLLRREGTDPAQSPAPAPGPGPAPLPSPAPAPALPRPKAGASLPPEAHGSIFLSDPQNELLRFQEALARVEGGADLARVLHFGDSVVTGDLITGEARARLQRRFGNGGPGWIYLQRPWEWYGRPGLTLKGSGWRIQAPMLTARKDHLYGLGGLAFQTAGGAETLLGLPPSEPFSVLELHLLPQPRGGRLQIQVDRAVDLEVDCAGEGGEARKVLPLPADAPHALRLRAKGEVLLHGLVLERPGPGVVYDAIGSNGGTVRFLASIEAGHWIQALRLRRPDLVVLAFGTNEVGYYNIPGPAYAADYRELVRRIREALPRASILVMGPMDRGERRPEGGVGSMPNLLRIVEAQKRIAADLGLAFFDTFRAMGGEGAAGRWYQASPRLMTGDFTHPTRAGADRIAALLVDALTRKYQAWRGEVEPVPGREAPRPTGPPPASPPN